MGSSIKGETCIVKLLAIKTKDKIYLSDNVDNKPYWNNNFINTLLFDGETALRTYINDWYSINRWPDKVEKIVPGKIVNYRWRLKPGYPVSALTPNVLLENPEMEDSEYNQVMGLYIREYDTLPETTEEIGIEWKILADLPEYTIEHKKYTVKNNLIDEITTNPVLLSECPCSIGGEYLYNLVRQYIKQGIDGRYARISNDYAFSFEVRKSLKYAEPVRYQTEEGTGKKKHMVTRYKTVKEEIILKMGDGSKGYGKYPDRIQAPTYKELEVKVDQYLKDILQIINEPLVECSCCNGLGAVIEKVVI